MRFYFRLKNAFMGNFKVSTSEFATWMNSWESFANIYQIIFNACLQNSLALPVTLSPHFPLLLLQVFFAATASLRDLSRSKFQLQTCAKTSKQATFSNSALLAALWKVSEAFCLPLKALNPTMSTRYFRGESTFKVNCNLEGPGIELEPNRNWTVESEWYFYLNLNKKVTVFVSYQLNQKFIAGKTKFTG